MSTTTWRSPAALAGKLFAILLVFGLTGCGGKDGNVFTNDPLPTATATTIPVVATAQAEATKVVAEAKTSASQVAVAPATATPRPAAPAATALPSSVAPTRAQTEGQQLVAAPAAPAAQVAAAPVQAPAATSVEATPAPQVGATKEWLAANPAAADVLAVSQQIVPVAIAADMVPSPPIFGEGDIVEVANAALAAVGPKGPVYPRVIRGGVYSPDSGREEFEAAMMAGAPTAMGTSDFWSAFSYDGKPGDNCAWFFPLTEDTANPAELSAGVIQEVVFLRDQRSVIESPAVRLDAMMATCLVALDNVGARALTKNAGILSLVLVDGQMHGSAAVAFAVPPQFVNNFTGGDPNKVPAVIINGMPGQPVLLSYFNGDGQNVASQQAEMESVNGTLSIEVPSNEGFVIVSMPVIGSNPNANTEVLMRMGSQPLGDTEGKNWIPIP